MDEFSYAVKLEVDAIVSPPDEDPVFIHGQTTLMIGMKWITFEVLQCNQTVFHMASTGDATSLTEWLKERFDIDPEALEGFAAIFR